MSFNEIELYIKTSKNKLMAEAPFGIMGYIEKREFRCITLTYRIYCMYNFNLIYVRVQDLLEIVYSNKKHIFTFQMYKCGEIPKAGAGYKTRSRKY
jgi:hypothetical protein